MTLLIADDELLIRSGLLSLDWKSIGITEVYSVSNGTEARELLLSTDVDIVIFDIRMPGMTGLELAAMIKEHSMDTAVVLLTGFSEFEYARQALQSNVYEYLLKPFSPRDILSTVADVKERLEQKRYQVKVIRKYEDTKGAYDTVSQVKNHFSKVSRIVSDVLMDMAKEFDQPLSLSGFSERYHFSSNYISKKIKQETGYSFVDILMAIRIMNSAQLLAEGERVNQACTVAGFNDQRYFSQVFKRAFGCSPTDFKKQEHSPQEIRLHVILEILDKKQAE